MRRSSKAGHTYRWCMTVSSGQGQRGHPASVFAPILVKCWDVPGSQPEDGHLFISVQEVDVISSVWSFHMFKNGPAFFVIFPFFHPDR